MSLLLPFKFLRRKWQQIQKHYYIHRDPVKLTRIRYFELFGEEPDLENPATLNEKILWLNLFSDTSRWTLLADKYRVREYVKQCGLGNILNELYGVWTSADNIDFGRLHTPFVLKTNNGYGDIIVVHNSQNVDTMAIRRKLDRALKKNFGLKTAEHHYLGITPCIIAEKFLSADPKLGCSLVDYKFYCFDGVARYCMVCYNRTSSHNVKTALYDAHTWEDLRRHVSGKYRDPHQRAIPRPSSLEQMLSAAEKLAKGFPQIRVDLYETEGHPIFGELTFTSATGMDTGFTPEFQREMGSYITLPNKVHRGPSV